MSLPTVIWDTVFLFCSPVDRSSTMQASKKITMQKFTQITSKCSDDQRNVIHAICFSNKNILEVGGPGTGKSFTILCAKKMLDALGLRHHTCAFTGLAA